MKNIFLLVGVTIAFASVVYSQTTAAPTISGTKICQAITGKSAAATAAYKKLSTALKNNEQLLPKTTAYLKKNEANLVDSVSSCLQVLDGAKVPLLADYQNADAAQQAAVTRFLQNVEALFLAIGK